MSGRLNTSFADLSSPPSMPHIDEMVASVPSAEYLLAYWRDALLTLDGANVEAWGSYGGYDAVQATGSKQPDYAAGVVTGDGSDDYLATEFGDFDTRAGTGGYFVATIIPGTINTGTSRMAAGQQTSPTERLYLAIGTTGLWGAAIGSVSSATLAAAGLPVIGVQEVIGVAWDNAGNASFRRNGTEVDTATYTGTLGTLPMFMCARNFGGTPGGFNNWGIKKLRFYAKSAGLSDPEMDAIDADMAT